MPTCPTCGKDCAEGTTVCPVDGTPLVAGDPRLGQVLGDRYRLLARLAEGGMGTIYRAEHTVLRKRMAVKVLRPELCLDEDLVHRFQQEAIAASQIGQENIVDVTDFGRTPDGALYFVMEELDGVSLATLLQTVGPLAVERALLVLAQLCRALAAAHARGIVHRDLKPDNVVVVRREDGSDLVKVVDFGISKTGREDGRVTRAGTIIGTPEYMSPEQGAAAAVDHRSDVYAFGVVAYELLTGTLPFRGETALGTLLDHRTRAPEPPGRRRAGLPPALEALVLRMLEKRPEARPQSMAEVGEELGRILAGLGLPPVFDRPPAGVTPAPVRRGYTQRFEREDPPTTAPGLTLAYVDEAQAAAHGEAAGVAAPRLTPDPARPAAGAARGRTRAAALAVVVLAVTAAGAVALRRASLAAWAARAAPATPAAAAPASIPTELPAAALPIAPPRAAVHDPPRAPPAPAPAAPGRGRPGRRSPAAGGQDLGADRRSGENPYRALEDLKPDPF